jgi:hypothetical protein
MKQKRYWLRGGVVGLIIMVITLFVVGYLSKPGACLNFGDAFLIPNPIHNVALHCQILFIGAYTKNPIGYLILPVVWFLIGTIIGCTCGKIKNRNKITQ